MRGGGDLLAEGGAAAGWSGGLNVSPLRGERSAERVMMVFHARHGDRSRRARRHTCAAARAPRCINKRLRNAPEGGAKANGSVIAALTTHPAFDFALRQARAANHRSPRPRRCIRHAVQSHRDARRRTGATFRAAALLKAHLREAPVTHTQNALRADVHTGIAARAAFDKITLRHRPRRPGPGAVRSGSHLTTQKESTARVHQSTTPHLSRATPPTAPV